MILRYGRMLRNVSHIVVCINIAVWHKHLDGGRLYVVQLAAHATAREALVVRHVKLISQPFDALVATKLELVVLIDKYLILSLCLPEWYMRRLVGNIRLILQRIGAMLLEQRHNIALSNEMLLQLPMLSLYRNRRREDLVRKYVSNNRIT